MHCIYVIHVFFAGSQYGILFEYLLLSDLMAMELLSAASTIRQLQEEVLNLQQQLASSILKQETLTRQLNEGKQEPTPITSDCPQCQIFSPEVVVNSKQKNLFTHYTGLTYATFIVLFRFLVPDPAKIRMCTVNAKQVV